MEKGPNDITLTVPPESLCGCGSKKSFGDCHKVNQTFAPIVPKSMNAPGSATGKIVKRCYLSFTNNCDGKVTGEHILSRSVLSEITEKKIVLTFGPQGTREHSLNSDSLKVNRLCKRHNNGLHRMDSEAGRFIAALRSVEFALLDLETPAQRFFIFHLYDLERWLLKTLINMYYARLTPPGCRLPSDIMLGFFSEYDAPYGFYVQYLNPNGKERQFKFDNSVNANVILHEEVICGLAISFSGFNMVLALPSPLAHTRDFLNTHVLRPAILGFYRGQEMVSLVLGSGKGSNKKLWLRQGEGGERPVGIVGAKSNHLTQ